MLDDFGKDMLMLGGTVVGFIATVLTLLEKLLEVKARFTSLTSKKERKPSSPTEHPAADSPSTIGFFSSKPLRGVSYLLLYETSVIVAAGLLLNYIGLTLSRHLESILFLDMTGTALVALSLGPLVGSHCRAPLEFRRELVVVPGNRRGCGHFPLVAGQHRRRILLGLDGQATRLSDRISAQGAIPLCPMVGSYISLGSAARSS